jgi:hypothetical protein
MTIRPDRMRTCEDDAPDTSVQPCADELVGARFIAL